MSSKARRNDAADRAASDPVAARVEAPWPDVSCPGRTYEGIPREFAIPAAYGDLLAALLALAAIPAVAMKWKSARALVWVFNVEGTVDLAFAIFLATRYEAAPFMGAAYWIPAFWVPTLLVTHYITYVVLLKHWKHKPQMSP